MSREKFADAALIVVAHGSTANPDSAAPAYQHADEIRRRGIFGEVAEAFWKQEPFVWSIFRSIFAPRVFIVPLFVSAGYFTDEVIPRELGFPGSPSVERRGERLFHYCEPVGTHASMADVVLARARQVIADSTPTQHLPEPGETALFVAGHGTSTNENSRRSIERVVESIRARGSYTEVHSVFLEEEPRIQDCYRMTAMRNLVVVPFFISDGLHSHEDIPALLGEPAAIVQERFRRGEPTWMNPTEKRGKRVWYSRAIGTEPQIAEVILERVREAALNEGALMVGSRS